jgi:hypothetical protein
MARIRFVLFMFIGFFYSFIGEKKKGQINRVGDELIGNVKSVTWYSYWGTIKSGFPVKDSLKRKWINEYDIKGNKPKETNYNLDGSISSVNTYTFDERGHNISLTINSSKRGITSYTYDYKLDESGRVVEKKFNTKRKEIYKYDSMGHEVEEDTYNGDGSIADSTTYSYDTKGNLIEWKLYNLKGILLRHSTKSYDSTGNCIEETDIEDNWNKDYISKYKLNLEDVNHHKKYKYDNHGNKIEMDEIKMDGRIRIYIYQYEYDKIGNWIKYVFFVDDKIQGIVEREIQYY